MLRTPTLRLGVTISIPRRSSRAHHPPSWHFHISSRRAILGVPAEVRIGAITEAARPLDLQSRHSVGKMKKGRGVCRQLVRAHLRREISGAHSLPGLSQVYAEPPASTAQKLVRETAGAQLEY